MNNTEQANFIWSIADLLRGEFKQSEYGKVILPFTVLRRFDCVLEPSKEEVLKKNAESTLNNKAGLLTRTTGYSYYNISKFDFKKLLDDSTNLQSNLRHYIHGYSENVKEILNHFDINSVIEKLNKANLLYHVVQKFAQLNLGTANITNLQMGYMFEELIRKFSEQSNETAGEHFTPREVIELMVDVLLLPDSNQIKKSSKIIHIFDPACGTGGMLSVAQNRMMDLNPKTDVEPFGQELNSESYATCKADMILKGNESGNIKLGNSFTEDGFKGETFDYMFSNPPFGVEWKKVQDFIKKEAESEGFNGRFGAGLPRISDGSLLFLQHMISKMTPVEKGGSRIGIVFNGSPLFTGDAGSGESDIRKWVIENDYLEAIIALPEQLFYNTGIATYIWIVTNKKGEKRKGKIRLINGVSYYEKMRKSLGSKRNEITKAHQQALLELYSQQEAHKDYIDFDNADFGYYKIVVERPLLDENGKPVLDKKGKPSPDPKLRDTETVPLKEDIHEYFKREVLPHVPDAWIDETKTKIGYEIPFTRHFYEFTPMRNSQDVLNEIKALEDDIQASINALFSH